MRIVLDTNVWISATFWKGDSDAIVKSIDGENIFCFISLPLLMEYKDVLTRAEIAEKIKNKNLAISETTRETIEDAILVEPKEKLNIIKDDPSDNIVLECAKEAKANYIVSSDKHLLNLKIFENIKIITPKEFLKIK